MRYFKVVLATFFSVIGAAALCVGIMYLAGFFNPTIVNPESISFEVTEYISDTDFKLKVTTPTEGVTVNEINLSLKNGVTEGNYLTDGIIKVPKTVYLDKEFDVSVVQIENAELGGILWNKGGHSVLAGTSSYVLALPTNNVDIYIDVPVYSLSVGFYDLNDQDKEIIPKTISSGEADPEEDGPSSELAVVEQLAVEETQVVELAIGSMFKVKGKFLPSESKYMAKSGLEKEVLFEIPADYAEYLAFQDNERSIVKILGQTANNDVKINAYCFKTTNESLSNQDKSQQEKISLMRAIGSAATSEKIYGSTVQISKDGGFRSLEITNQIELDINKPIILYANKTSGLLPGELSLGMQIFSDVADVSIQDQVVDVRLKIFEWVVDRYVETNKVFFEKTATQDENDFGLLAKINLNKPNNSYWKIIADPSAENRQFCIKATLVETVYSLATPEGETVEHKIDFTQMKINPVIETDASWASQWIEPLAQKNLTIINQSETTEKIFPQIDLNSKVVINNANATFKTIKFFAYCTDPTHTHEDDGCNLENVIACKHYADIFEVPGGSLETIYEITDGILTCFEEASFNVFFVVVESDYRGKEVYQKVFDEDHYILRQLYSATEINEVPFLVYKTLKTLNSFVGVDETLNQNTNEDTKAYELHFRQQSETPPLSITVYSDNYDVFDREYKAGKIKILFYDSETNERTNLFTVTEASEYIHHTDMGDDGWGYTFSVDIGTTSQNHAKNYYAKVLYSSNQSLEHIVAITINTEAGAIEKNMVVKVLTGLVTSIEFKNAETTVNNPVVVSVVTLEGGLIERKYMLGETELTVAMLSEITTNADALNKNYVFTSSKKDIVSITADSNNKPTFVVNGTRDEVNVVITATPEDGSGVVAYLHLLIEKGPRVELNLDGNLLDGSEQHPFQFSIDGVENNTVDLDERFTALSYGADADESTEQILVYSTDIADIEGLAAFVSLNDGEITINQTFGRIASFHLYLSIPMLGYNACVTVTINSGYVLEKTDISSDNNLSDIRELDGTIYYSVYGQTTKNIEATLTIRNSPENNYFNEDALQIVNNGAMLGDALNTTYNSGTKVLTFNFPEVSTPTNFTIKYSYPTSESAYALEYYFRFAVHPNVRLEIVDDGKIVEDPYVYDTSKVLYNNDGTGAVKLARISGDKGFVNSVSNVKINNVPATNTEGLYKFPIISTVDTQRYEVSLDYMGINLTQNIYVKPKIELGTLESASYVQYNNVRYLKLVSGDEQGIALPEVGENAYNVGTSQNLVISDEGMQLRAHANITRIITNEMLVVENNLGVVHIPLIILPINTYGSSQYFVNYRTEPEPEDLYFALNNHYDEIDGGETISLSEILGDNRAGWTYSVVNEDGTKTVYATCNGENIVIMDIGRQTQIRVQIKCGGVDSYSYIFDYRVRILANQKFETRYPYLSGVSLTDGDRGFFDDETNQSVSNLTEWEYLAFDDKKSVSVDLDKAFDIEIPNAIRTETENADDTTLITYSGKRITLYKGDGVADNTKISYEIFAIEIAGRKIAQSDFATHAQINADTAVLTITKAENVFSDIYVIVRAYTNTGAETFYRVVAAITSPEYKVEFDNNDITDNLDFEIVLYGGLENLGELDLSRFKVSSVDGVVESVLPQSAYSYRLINDNEALVFNPDENKLLTKDVTKTYSTQIFIYTKTGEVMRRINVYVDPILDYDFKKVDFIGGETIDFMDNTHLFKTIDAVDIDLNEKSYKVYTTSYVTIENKHYFENENQVIYNGFPYEVVDNKITIGDAEYVLNAGMEIGSFNLSEIVGTEAYRPYVLIDQVKHYVKTASGKEVVTYNGQDYEVDDDKKITINYTENNKTDYYVTRYYSVSSTIKTWPVNPSFETITAPVIYFNVDDESFDINNYIKITSPDGAPMDFATTVTSNAPNIDGLTPGVQQSIEFVDAKWMQFSVGKIVVLPYQMFSEENNTKRVGLSQFASEWLGEESSATYISEDVLNTEDYIFMLDDQTEVDKWLTGTGEIVCGTTGTVEIYAKDYEFDATEQLKAYYNEGVLQAQYSIETQNCNVRIENAGDSGYKYYLAHTGTDLSEMVATVTIQRVITNTPSYAGNQRLFTIDTGEGAQMASDWLGEDAGAYVADGALNTANYVFTLDDQTEFDKILTGTGEIAGGTIGIVYVAYKYNATEDLKDYYNADVLKEQYSIVNQNCEVFVENVGENNYYYYLVHTGTDVSDMTVTFTTQNIITNTPTYAGAEAQVDIDNAKTYEEVLRSALGDQDENISDRYQLRDDDGAISLDAKIDLHGNELSELRVMQLGKQVGWLILYNGAVGVGVPTGVFSSDFEYNLTGESASSNSTATYKIERWAEATRIKQRIESDEIKWVVTWTDGDHDQSETNYTDTEGVPNYNTEIKDTLANATTPNVTKDYHIAVSGEAILPKAEDSEEYVPFEFDFSINIGINVSIKTDVEGQTYSKTNPLDLGQKPAKVPVDISLDQLFSVEEDQIANFGIACTIEKGNDAIASSLVADNKRSVSILSNQVHEDVEVLVKVDLKTTGGEVLLTAYVRFVVEPSVIVAVNYIKVGNYTLSPEPVYQKEYASGGFNLFGTSQVADNNIPRVVITEGEDTLDPIDADKDRIKVAVKQDANKHIITDDDGIISNYNSIKFNAGFAKGSSVSDITLEIKVDDVVFAQYYIRLYKDNIYTAELNTENRIVEEGVEIIPIQGSGAEDILGNDRFTYKINSFVIDNPNDAFTIQEDSDRTIDKTQDDDEAKTVVIKGPGGDTSFEYKYKRVWDYQFGKGATLETTKVTVPEDSGGDGSQDIIVDAFVLLSESYANVYDGKYDLITHFGLKTYLGHEFSDGDDDKCIIELSVPKLVLGNASSSYPYVDKTGITNQDNIVIIAHGAPNDGVVFQFDLSPFGEGANKPTEVFYVLIMPSISIEPVYDNVVIENLYIDDNNKYIDQSFEVISEETEAEFVLYDEAELINRLAISKCGIVGAESEIKGLISSFKFSKVYGDGTVATTLYPKITLTFDMPLFEDKYYIVGITDVYGYEAHMGFKVLAQKPALLPIEKVTFYTGDDIMWKPRDAFGLEDSSAATSDYLSFPFIINGYKPIVLKEYVTTVSEPVAPNVPPTGVPTATFYGEDEEANEVLRIQIVIDMFEEVGNLDQLRTTLNNTPYYREGAMKPEYELHYKVKGEEIPSKKFNFNTSELTDGTVYLFAIVESTKYNLSYEASSGGFCFLDTSLLSGMYKFNQFGNDTNSPFASTDQITTEKLTIKLTDTKDSDNYETIELPFTLKIRYKAIVEYPNGGDVLYLPDNTSDISIVATREATSFSLHNNSYGVVKLMDRKTGSIIAQEADSTTGIITTADVSDDPVSQSVVYTYDEKTYSVSVNYLIVSKYCGLKTNYVNGLTYLEIPNNDEIDGETWQKYVSLKDYYGRIYSQDLSELSDLFEYGFSAQSTSNAIDAQSGKLTNVEVDNFLWINVKYNNDSQPMTDLVVIKIVGNELEFFAGDTIEWATTDPWWTKKPGEDSIKNKLAYTINGKLAVIQENKAFETISYYTNKEVLSVTADLNSIFGLQSFINSDGTLNSDNYALYYRNSETKGYATNYDEYPTIPVGTYDFAIVSKIAYTLSYSWVKSSDDNFLGVGESYLNASKTSFNNYGNGVGELFNGKEYVYIHDLVVKAGALTETLRYSVKLNLRYEVRVKYPVEGDTILYLPANTSDINLSGYDNPWDSTPDDDIVTTNLTNYGVMYLFDRKNNANVESGCEFMDNSDLITTGSVSELNAQKTIRIGLEGAYYYGKLNYNVVDICATLDKSQSVIWSDQSISMGSWGSGLTFKDCYGRTISLNNQELFDGAYFTLDIKRTTAYGQVWLDDDGTTVRMQNYSVKILNKLYHRWPSALLTIKDQSGIIIGEISFVGWRID